MTSSPPTNQAAHVRWLRFRASRANAVVAPLGQLALVNTQWISGDPADASTAQPIWGVPGIWAPLPAGESGLSLTAAASDGITVNGVVVDGTVTIGGPDAVTPGEIRFSDTVQGTIISGEAGYALRVWDAESEGIREFDRIDSFDYDPAWVLDARFTPISGGGTVDIAHLHDDGRTRPKALPGEIAFSHAGVDYSIAAFQEEDALLLVFADETNGVDTYSVGRFLRVVPGADGHVALDFNRAYVPPCGFSYNFNCPIPPKQNRFPFRVEAGEKNPVRHDGSPLH